VPDIVAMVTAGLTGLPVRGVQIKDGLAIENRE
jgi:hypothetical protein